MKNARQKQSYESMEPVKKRIRLEKKYIRDTANKQELQTKRAQQYKSMDSNKINDLSNKNAERYKTMDTAKKQNLLEKQKESYKTMDTTTKQNLLDKLKEKYKTMDASKKQNLLDKQKENYKTMDTTKKQNHLDKQKENYKAMDTTKKQNLQEKLKEKYKTMDATKKQNLLDKQKENYKTMDTNKKQDLLEKRTKENYSCSQNKTLATCITQFKNKIQQGPYYICCVCNRALYKKSVLQLIPNKYPSPDILNIQSSFDGKEYICRTCHSKALSGKIPCQAIANNLIVDDVPTELENLQKLEQIIIAQRIVFEKVVFMPKGQQRKIKGAICNVPVECDQTCRVLPRQ